MKKKWIACLCAATVLGFSALACGCDLSGLLGTTQSTGSTNVEEGVSTGNGGNSASSSTNNDNSSSSSTVKETYTVTFKHEDGTVIDTVTVTEGEKIPAAQKPDDPSKQPTDVSTSYEFDGWYNGTDKWDFNTDTVDENVELTAKFKEVKFGPHA